MPSKKAKPAYKPQDIDVISPLNLKHNVGVLTYFRNMVSVFLGIFVGILGVTGWKGFLPHFVGQLLCVFPMMMKGAIVPRYFFHTWNNLLFFNVFSSTTLLSYILFWMIFYNICHIF